MMALMLTSANFDVKNNMGHCIAQPVHPWEFSRLRCTILENRVERSPEAWHESTMQDTKPFMIVCLPIALALVIPLPALVQQPGAEAANSLPEGNGRELACTFMGRMSFLRDRAGTGQKSRGMGTNGQRYGFTGCPDSQRRCGNHHQEDSVG